MNDITYEMARHFSDTWGLLFLFLVFVAVIVWVMRPGAGKKYDRNAEIPFAEDE